MSDRLTDLEATITELVPHSKSCSYWFDKGVAESKCACDRKRVLAALAELVEIARESEAYAKEGWAWLDEALAALGVETVFDIAAAEARAGRAEEKIAEMTEYEDTPGTPLPRVSVKVISADGTVENFIPRVEQRRASLTDLEATISTVRNLAAKATPSPWDYDGRDIFRRDQHGAAANHLVLPIPATFHPTQAVSGDDIAFIVAARNFDWPAIAELVEIARTGQEEREAFRLHVETMIEPRLRAEADRKHEALLVIRDAAYGLFATTGDYAAFIRDVASNAVAATGEGEKT